MKKLVLGLLVVVLVVPAAGYLYLRRFLPDYGQTVEAPGLGAEVRVERNRYAVPTITARNDEDLFFAWGYVNAQDRLFQMEVTKRIGQGRLSEFAGPSTLSKDLFLRAMGFYDLARKEADRLPPDSRRLVQRYVDGVNHFQKTHPRPLYMVLLGLESEPWTPADPLTVGMMLNWSLAYNMHLELLYHRIRLRLGPEGLAGLMNLAPKDSPTIVDDRPPTLDEETRFLARPRELAPLTGCVSASNNWVLAPGRTAVSGPILASDPHVHGSRIPSDFYLVRVRSGEFEAAGGQVSGLPFIAFGYNRNLAWGLTNNGADIVDLFFEKVDWEKKTYTRNGVQRPLTARTVEIKVKGGPPVVKTLYRAGRRPLLNEVFPDYSEPLSIDWAGFDGLGAEGFFRMNRARDRTEFSAAADLVRMTPQNLVYAHRSGEIGYQVMGAIPDRRAGTGNLPSDGARTESNWDGLLLGEMNPALSNPERGFIITANNRTIRDFPYDMNPTYAPRYRYDRIAAMLEARRDIDAAYTREMQNDPTSVLAGRIIPLMKKLVRVENDKQAARALDLVLKWDGRNRPGDSAPSIYNTFLVRFMYQTLADELGPDLAEEYVSQRYVSLEPFLSMVDRGSPFFDDVGTAEKKETASDIAGRAFRESLALLGEYFKTDDPAAWAWGRVHLLRFEHILGRSKLLRPLVNRGPLEVGGDCETNLRGHFYEIKPPYTAELASGLRLIVAFDPDPKGWLVLITGQSEYFLSPHYTDLTDLWMKGEYFSMEDEPARYRAVFKPE